MSLLDNIHNDSASQYRDFFAQNREDRLVGDVLLYGLDSLLERNQTHQLEEYMPGWFSLGDDSGGSQFLMKLDGCAAVFACEAGALGSLEPVLVHPEFGDWLSRGCPLPQAPPVKLPLAGDFWMIESPPNGLKDLLKLKQTLALQHSLGQLKEYLQGVPCRIAANIPCINWDGRLEKLPELRHCFVFTPLEGKP